MKKTHLDLTDAVFRLLKISTVLVVVINLINIIATLSSAPSAQTILFLIFRVLFLYYVVVSIFKTQYKDDWTLITGLQFCGVIIGLLPLIKQYQNHQPLYVLPIIMQALYVLLWYGSKSKFTSPKSKMKLPKKLKFLNKDL